MHAPLQIATVHLPDDIRPHTFDMAGRCAFAICTKGEFKIRIFNEHYTVGRDSILACMPFVNIEVSQVIDPAEVIIGYIRIQEVPVLINRWVNTYNLSHIQSNPLVSTTSLQTARILEAIRSYQTECTENSQLFDNEICNRIQSDIIDFKSSLIIALVLRTYFTNMPMRVSGHSHRDIIFLRFTLSLYGNFREHREVSFYAERSGVSLKYFSTIIRQLTGTTPSQWIETVVIAEAKSLLADLNRSIKSIAITLNFPDAPTFTKYFQRITGVTPKEFRKSILP